MEKTPKRNSLEKGQQEVAKPRTASTTRVQEMEMHVETLIFVVSVRLSSSLEMWDGRKKEAA